MLQKENMPNHVAIIMDGNGRWAEKRKLPRVMGHNAGMKAMKEIVKKASILKIQHLTVYAFSTENWKRSKEEVGGIFKLLIKYVNSELDELVDNNVKVSIIGNYEELPAPAVEKLNKLVEKTSQNNGLHFNIALNYGSRAEIVKAVATISKKIKAGEISVDMVDEELVDSYLYTGEQQGNKIPDPDLLIRTSGEKRLSNYLLWQLAYSELAFVDLLWPDFTPQEFEKTIEVYQSRIRRFGGR